MSYPPGPPGSSGSDEPGHPEEPGRSDAPEPPGYGQAPGYGQPGDPGQGYPPGTPYGGGYPPAGGGPGYPGPPPTNSKATAALITGITTLVLSWCCGAGVLGAVAIVLGVKARSEIRASQGTQSGDGLALAGIITGAVAILLGILVLILIILAIASGQAAYTDYYNEFG
jgi:hypothetical protein